VITGIANGDFSVGIFNFGTISTGAGNDLITGSGSGGNSTGIFNYGAINTGDGNDTLIANGSFNNYGGVNLGTGNDYLKGFGPGSFDGGEGQDTLELTAGTYTIGVSGTTISFTGKGSFGFDVTMNTVGFEKLIAGSTTYNFASLTNAQTITVS
jgi:hypothetical protein